ncbi:MAG TPA: peptide deformylase [Saprospiraceae bacterium]|nr:peptide deformylase [Saprospiraceae bacterium]
MIRSIYAYGQAVLKRRAKEINPEEQLGLETLIKDMWETMENANGVGLAAPQIGKSMRIFIIDTKPMYPEEEQDTALRKVFINPVKIEEEGEEWKYEEGCLSIPDVTGEVLRPERIALEYLDEQFEKQTEVFEGMNARVIQHEYDHLEGVLFTEKLPPIKRRRIRKKLKQIEDGKIQARYKMKFA